MAKKSVVPVAPKKPDTTGKPATPGKSTTVNPNANPNAPGQIKKSTGAKNASEIAKTKAKKQKKKGK